MWITHLILILILLMKFSENKQRDSRAKWVVSTQNFSKIDQKNYKKYWLQVEIHNIDVYQLCLVYQFFNND